MSKIIYYILIHLDWAHQYINLQVGKWSSGAQRLSNTCHLCDIEQVMQHVFQPLLSAEPHDGENLFQTEVTGLYVCALDFISDLASHDGQWLKLYSDLLQHKQVQMILAVALYTGEENIKRQVLMLTGTVGFPAER